MIDRPFVCRICGFTSDDEDAVTACYAQNTENFTFEIGEYVAESPSGQSFWIVDRHIGRATPKKGMNHPQHIPRYQLSTQKEGGRKHWKNQKDLYRESN